jgi:hypothetical protein
MAMKKKPQGKFAAGKVEAPRKITVRGETHYLVYVTPEEAKGLKKAGGTGEAGPKGIPAFPRGSVSKEKVDKAKAKTSTKSTPAKSTTKTVTNTGSRGSEKKAAPAPKDRDDRQPTPTPTPTPTPKPATRSIVVPDSSNNDNGPTAAEKAAEKAAAAAKVQALADSKAEAEAQALADSKAKAIADKAKAKAKADAEDLAMAQAVLPKVGPNPKMTTMPTVEEKLIRSRVDADIGSGVAEEKIGTQATTATAVAPVVADPKVVTTPVADPKVVTTPVADPKVVTPKDTGVAAVKTEVPFKGTMKDGVLVDRLGNPVVTNKKGYGYLDPLTGLAVTPWTDSINGGGPGYGGAAFGSGGGAALDTNKDNYISEAEIAAGKAKGLELEQNAISKIGTGLGVTPLGSGIDPTGIAGFADSGILGFARKLGTPAYTRPDSSIAPGQELNKWWEADKNALGFAYGTQDEISQRRAKAKEDAAFAAANSQNNDNDNDNGPVAPTVPIVTTPPNYTANAQQAFAPIPNPNYNPADPMSLAYLTNPSYEELLAYRNSGTTPARPFAKGGIANLVKDGGNEKTIISDAIRAVEGKMSERDSAISLAKFVKAHGEPALRDLVDKVSSGEYADTRERFANGENGMVRGPGNGSGTDDKVPATIDGEQDVLLADGEMVLRKKTTDAIEKAYPGLLDRINAAEGDAPKVLAKALDFIEGRNRRG